MADPATMMAVSSGGKVAGAVLGAIGARQSSKAQSNQYMYQAGVAQVNQQIAKQNADHARAVGEVDAQRTGMKTRFAIGTARATQGGRGLDVNTGSNLRVRESIADVGAQDTALVRHNAARRAYGYEIEANQQGAQVGMFQAAAANSRAAGKIAMWTSILGGATSVASDYSKASQTGAFKSSASADQGWGNEFDWAR